MSPAETPTDKDVQLGDNFTQISVVAIGDDFDYDYTPEEVEAYRQDPQLVRSVTRAMDLRIMPLCFSMYLFSALDRGNISRCLVCDDKHSPKVMPKPMALTPIWDWWEISTTSVFTADNAC